jgi:hypothetical protein
MHRGDSIVASPKQWTISSKVSTASSSLMLFHGIPGETTIKAPVTTPDAILPTPPSHVDSDISVYVSGIGAYQVRYYFSFLIYLTILHQLQKLGKAECKDY